jgi:hypothetical protein
MRENTHNTSTEKDDNTTGDDDLIDRIAFPPAFIHDPE